MIKNVWVNTMAGLKMLAFVFTVIFYITTSLCVYPVVLFSPFKGRQILSYIISFYCKVGLAFMGVKVNATGALEKVNNSFIVSNHLGYLDILVISSYLPSCFVTSLEIRKTPFLGQLCELGGCLYVDRKNKQNLSKEVEMLSEGLRQGLNICVFPEGTSTDGSSVIRFKRPLFRAAIESGVPVISLCLNYKEINNVPVSSKNRDTIFWYGDMSFFPHFWSFLKQSSVLVELKLLTEIEKNDDHVKLSEDAHQTVFSAYQAIV